MIVTMTARRTLLRLVALALFSLPLLTTVPALAGPLDDAKAAGYIGERPDGYLGLVNPNAPAAVKSMVKSINDQRREHYKQIAGKDGTSLQAVEAIAGKTVIKKAAPGTYIMTGSGQWVRK